MATFGELKTKASRRLQDAMNTDVSASDVGDEINAAIRYLKQKYQFWFNRGQVTATTTIGNPLLTVPTTLLYLSQDDDGMVIPYQGYTYGLYSVPPDYYDAYNVGSQGRPYAYTYRNGGYYLYYYPDQAYTVNLSGIKDYADLVNDSDTNDWTNLADRLVLYESLSRLCQIRDDFEKADNYSLGALDEAANLQERTDNMLMSGTMRTYTNETYNTDYYS